MLTMHPHTSGRFARLEALDRLISYIKQHDGIEFTTCIALADSWNRMDGE